MGNISVIGAGSWGTAIAIHLARNGHNIRLWDRDTIKLRAMQNNRSNPNYLSDHPLPANIEIRVDFTDCVSDSDNYFIAVPSHGFKETLSKLAPILKRDSLVIWGSKGLVEGKFLHQIAKECLGKQHRFVALSGPSFAKEVALGLPTAVTVASEEEEAAKAAAKLFHSSSFRPYVSTDIQGVEIGGVVKNVIAIGVGISDGLGFGANARSALITRGLFEMTQLGLLLGAQINTFYGLAGLGDLILTATDDQSRNRRFGLALGRGFSIQQAREQIGQVVEGARNAEEIYFLAKKLSIDMPICNQVYQVLYQSLAPIEAVKNLLQREIRSE